MMSSPNMSHRCACAAQVNGITQQMINVLRTMRLRYARAQALTSYIFQTVDTMPDHPLAKHAMTLTKLRADTEQLEAKLKSSSFARSCVLHEVFIVEAAGEEHTFTSEACRFQQTFETLLANISQTCEALLHGQHSSRNTIEFQMS